MNREEHIAAILERRHPLARRIEQVQQNLERLAVTLEGLEKQSYQIMKRTEAEVSGHLRDLHRSLREILAKIVSEQRELEKLKRRFSRDTLNIGVVGRARQGKSRLLQSLSGLTNREIPDGRLQHCTGTRSIIYHNPDIQAYGEVKFYSEREFLDEVIAPYYRDEQLKKFLGYIPYTVDDFLTTPLPPLPIDIAASADAKAKYDHLKGYYDTIDKYKSLFYAKSPCTISTQEIRQYVAQDTIDGQRIYSNYRAVREVKIVCRFPHEDVGRIALVDMPGLGDTGIGDQARLVNILGEDIDVVLFVRMPKALGDAWLDVDIQLYELARSALTNLPINLWSFMVLNHIDVPSDDLSNREICMQLRETLLSEVHMTVADCFISNCADSTEVNGIVLDKVLNYLTENIDLLDKKYAASCQEHLLSLRAEIQVELEKAQQILGAGAASTDSDYALFDDLFEKLWFELTLGLYDFLDTLNRERDQHSPLLQQSIEDVLNLCRKETGVPSPTQLRRMMRAEYGAMAAYERSLNEIRTLMTRRFVSLDAALKATIQGIKERLVAVLLENGHLGGITEERGIVFLDVITKLLEILPSDRRTLQQALSILSTFELSYRGFIQYRVRRNLNKLNADPEELPKKITEEKLYKILNAKQAEAVSDLQQELATYLSDPNEVAFAIVEEFIDQILRAERAKRDWRLFYQEMRAEVWPAEFKQFAEQSYAGKQWLAMVDRCLETNQAQLFQFINPSVKPLPFRHGDISESFRAGWGGW